MRSIQEILGKMPSGMSENRLGQKESEPTDDFIQELLLERARRDVEKLNAEVGSENYFDGYGCEKCRNRGYIYFADGTKVYRTDCECLKARKTIRRMKASGLEKVIGIYRFENFETPEQWQKDIKEAAQRFVTEGQNKWFFVGGMSGAGKSHIATAICRKLLQSEAIQYILWESESVELKSRINDSEYYQDRVDQLKNVDCLYIDDFLSGRKEMDGRLAKPSFADVRLAREILGFRYAEKKRTIISTEWFSDEIMNEIDIALGGRINEMTKDFQFNIARDMKRNYRAR